MKCKSLLWVTAAALCTVACSDDPNQPAPEEPMNVAGRYEGYTLAGCNYFTNNCTDGESVVLTDNGDGTVCVAFVSDSWGEFSIPTARKASDGTRCTLTGEGETQMGMQGNIAAYDCSFTAEIESSGEARMRFSVPAVMGGLTIDFATGDAPAHLLLAGTYEGYTDADCAMFQNMYTDGEELRLTANDDGTLAIGFESATWGNFVVEQAAVVRDGGEYTFTGGGRVAMGMGGTSNDYDFTVTGRVAVPKEEFSISFNVPAVMGGLTVTLLPGSAPEAGE